MGWLALVIVAAFVVVHLAKMMRLYLVLMEHKIGFVRFLLLYCKTTFINLLVPFKLGEVYRVFCIWRETKVWQVGILSVLVDRFLDIVALFLVLLPLDILLTHGISKITVVFFLVVAVAVIVYLAIPPTYEYLNRYIIRYKRSRRSMAALKALDVVKNWYDFTSNLIRGRFALIILASLVGWIAEAGLLAALAKYLGISFHLGDFPAYIEGIFVSGQSSLAHRYTWYSAVIMLILAVVGYVAYGISKLSGRGRK